MIKIIIIIMVMIMKIIITILIVMVIEILIIILMIIINSPFQPGDFSNGSSTATCPIYVILLLTWFY